MTIDNEALAKSIGIAIIGVGIFLVLCHALAKALSESSSSRTAWIRKLFWPVTKKAYCKGIMKTNESLFKLPLIAFISLDSIPKRAYIEKGFPGLQEVMKVKFDELFETFSAIATGTYKDKYDKYREANPGCRLDNDEIEFIMQYQESNPEN